LREPAGDVARLKAGDLRVTESHSQSVVETLESYRNFLQDEAVSRQDILEVLGDTMLKLAFMGTIFGISSALFFARDLDTADPIEKLLAKAGMYAVIGVGFVTTLVGLSIVASLMRSNLSTRWLNEIGTAYRLILDYGSGRLREFAKNLLPETKTFLINGPRDKRSTTIDTLKLLGLIVRIGVALTMIYKYRATIMSWW
jgi:hypothetical protein